VPRLEDDTPIPVYEVAKTAFVTTLTLGVVGFCSARQFADSRMAITNARGGTV